MPNNPPGHASSSVGILAYGSLISEPGAEIDAVRLGLIREGVQTPFNVEYARTSRTRRGAPTLVPIEGEGNPVKAGIILINASEPEATNMLWRRETGKVGQINLTYARPSSPGKNDVVVEPIHNFHGVGVVLYTRIGINLVARDPHSLAKLAVESARGSADGRDGISYLMEANRNGIKTRYSEAYENAIKEQMGVNSLADALKRLQLER